MAGLLGGSFATIVLYLLLQDRVRFYSPTTVSLIVGVSAGFCIPAAISAYPELRARQANRVLRAGLRAGAVGAIAMTLVALLISGFASVEDVFFSLGGRPLIGAISWVAFGLVLGMVEGLIWRSQSRALLGAAGGALGGLCAFLLGYVLRNEGTFLLVGPLIGAGSGMIQDLFKQAWLRILSGPNEGAEIILDKARVVLGSSDGPDVDIGLFQDSAIKPKHFTIVQRNGEYILQVLPDAAPPQINGAPAGPSARLKDGDRILVGRTTLQFRSKTLTSA